MTCNSHDSSKTGNQDFHIRLIDSWQRDFPLCERPYELLACKAGVSEAHILDSLRQMHAQGMLSRVGAVVRPNTVGASTLAAMKIPAHELDHVAQIVNQEAGVNHNYEREHEFNLWFVATASGKASLTEMLCRIRARTGYQTINLPLQKAHHIDLGFALGKGACLAAGKRKKPPSTPYIAIDEQDRSLLAAIQEGLPLVPRPFAAVARQLQWIESETIARVQKLVESRIISRFGLIVRHRKLGYTQNAMAVWDIADKQVDELGDLLAQKSFVTLCYQRRRARPHWPYNLFCMIHGSERQTVLAQIDELNELVAGRAQAHTVLFSPRCFKQAGARFSSPSAHSGKCNKKSAPPLQPVELGHV